MYIIIIINHHDHLNSKEFIFVTNVLDVIHSK